MDSSANKALEILEAYGVNLTLLKKNLRFQTLRWLRAPKDIHYIDINAKGNIAFIPSYRSISLEGELDFASDLVFASDVMRDDYLFLYDCPIGETQRGN